jgi:tRNA threonylcarbamoyladenosine biosynthesis protein TsaE
MKTVYTTHSPEETLRLGEKTGQYLRAEDMVLLYGDLGSGKTQLTKGIALGLGITQKIKSPTFAYVNQYQVGDLMGDSKLGPARHPQPAPQSAPQPELHHYDLYRLNPGDDVASIGLEETMNDGRSINVVEWADRLRSLPERYIKVSCENHEDHHSFTFEFADDRIVPLNEVPKHLEHWQTPLHVRDHMNQVANVAQQLGQAMVNEGHVINLNHLRSAALLHDCARVCDFRELRRDGFKEEITEQKWNRWVKLRKVYKGRDHADIAHDYFLNQGYLKTAQVIHSHKSLAILSPESRHWTPEETLLFYADKRVRHDEVVSLTERFRDGRERYGKNNSPDKEALFRQVEEATHNLENRLFKQLDIKPEDIS